MIEYYALFATATALHGTFFLAYPELVECKHLITYGEFITFLFFTFLMSILLAPIAFLSFVFFYRDARDRFKTEVEYYAKNRR